jgi:hypothetical protein
LLDVNAFKRAVLSRWRMALRWFRKNEPALDTKGYAEWIYDTLVEGNRRDIEPERMLLPTETHRRYHEKALLYREAMSLYALWEVTRTYVDLLPVLHEYTNLLEAKGVGRGLRASRGELVDAVVEDLSAMFDDPLDWAQRWLREFRDNPRSEVGAVTFADHCMQQHATLKRALDQSIALTSQRKIET